MYSVFRIVNPCLCEKQIYQPEYRISVVLYAFILEDSMYYQNYLSHQFLPPFSEIVSYIHRMVLGHTAYRSGIPHPPQWFLFFFKFTYVEIHSLCCKVMSILKMHSVMHLLSQSHSEESYYLKISSALHLSSPPPWTQSIHWSSYCLCYFTFSTMSYKWWVHSPFWLAVFV